MNSGIESVSENRIIPMDRLRLFLVVAVVFMHAAVAYTNIPVLTVLDPQKNAALDIFLLLMDGILMPLLYFIAGYFAYISMKKRSRREFIVSKFRRVGLPFVAIGIFLAPYITYAGVRNYFPDPIGFFNFWIFQMKTAVQPEFVLISDMETATKHWMDYSPWHLWFVILLLIFYLLYAGWDILRERITGRNAMNKSVNRTGVLTSLAVASAVMILLYTAVALFVPEWVWTQTSIIHLQPSRIPIYTGIFILGIYAGSGNWFIDKEIPGTIWIWGTASVIFSIAIIPCMSLVLKSWGQIMPWQFSLLHGFIRTGMALTMLVFLIKLFNSRSAQKSILDRMSGVSYEIYILHLPLVVAVGELFTMVTMPALLKFFLAGIIITCICWALGRFLVKPYPKIAVLIIISVFLILCLSFR